MTATTSRRVPLTLLAQIVAIAGGVKKRSDDALTAAYHLVQKPQPFTGIDRKYQPKDDDGEQLPPESTPVQIRVGDVINDVSVAMARMLDVVATQEWNNTEARADLVLPDGMVLLTEVPVTYLMWLEKQVVHLRTFVAKLPVLDLAEDWHYDPDARAWATEATQTLKTKKVMKNHVLYPATDKHAAQVQVYNEDVVVGTWQTIRFSGAVPAAQVMEMAERVELLLDSIRVAREQANTKVVTDVTAGAAILTYIFA